jgi:hypothetical protein
VVALGAAEVALRPVVARLRHLADRVGEPAAQEHQRALAVNDGRHERLDDDVAVVGEALGHPAQRRVAA